MKSANGNEILFLPPYREVSNSILLMDAAACDINADASFL